MGVGFAEFIGLACDDDPYKYRAFYDEYHSYPLTVMFDAWLRYFDPKTLLYVEHPFSVNDTNIWFWFHLIGYEEDLENKPKSLRLTSPSGKEYSLPIYQVASPYLGGGSLYEQGVWYGKLPKFGEAGTWILHYDWADEKIKTLAFEVKALEPSPEPPPNNGGEKCYTMDELQKASDCFGCKIGNPCWENCKQWDINNDGRIDVPGDISYILLHLCPGEEPPPSGNHYKTIKKWVFGNEYAFESFSVKPQLLNHFWQVEKRTRNLYIPEGCHIEGARLIIECKFYKGVDRRIRVEFQHEEVFDEGADSTGGTIDVLHLIKPPPPTWGIGSNEVEVEFMRSILVDQRYDFKCCIEVVVYMSEPEAEDQPHWEEPGENGGKGCLMGAMIGTTMLAHYLFPYFRMFRDQILPHHITNLYYGFSTWILRMVHLLG